MTSNPVISIITPALDSEKTMDFFFQELKKQTYGKNKMEIIVIDGGSRDETVRISIKNGATVIYNPSILAEPGIYLGMKKAHGDLLMILATDNYYNDIMAIEKIVRVFGDKSIYAAFPKHDSEAYFSLFAKYINTFTDPFNHFIYGEAANARTFRNIYKTLEHNNIYDIYDFSSNNISPILAFAQGFTIRKDYSRTSRDKYDDIKPIISLTESGKKIAYVHSISLFHNTIKDYKQFIRKTRWATMNAIRNKNYGIAYRKKYLTFIQKIKMNIWPIYSLSLILPVIRSVIGLLQDKEGIWVFHPVICFLSIYASMMEYLSMKLRKNMEISRQ